MKKVIKASYELLKICFISVLVVTIITTQVFGVSQVRHSSMENTLSDGNILVIEKVSYHFNNPKTGDIVIINMTNYDNSFLGKVKILYSDTINKFSGKINKDRIVKRVIGVEGQKIDIISGNVYVDDKMLNENYVTSETSQKENSDVKFPLVVPKGEVFVLGDNRSVSYDSRNFDCVKTEQIEGKLFLNLFDF